MNGSNWQIEHQCPQCGAPVTLDETYRLLLCPFCRTKLFLEPGDHFRYCIPPPREASEDTLYIPYWRFKGLCYAFQGLEMTGRFTDVNLRALMMDGMPESLGLRPQAMKLKFASPTTRGRFIEPVLTLQDIMKKIGEINAPSGFHHAFIGEIASVIFAPVYLKNSVLHDAILNRPLSTLSPRVSEVVEKTAGPSNWQLRFVSTLCPHCSWDLEGEKDALVLLCRNCDSAWRCSGTELQRVPFAVMEQGDENAVYLPFWRMRARIEGLTLDSYADLIRIANLPKAVLPVLERQALYFWSPAFKVNPVLFLRWARQMTICQPEGDMTEQFSRRSCHPVNLPVSEALESVVLTIADIVNDKRRFFPAIPGARAVLDECLLVYHPFTIDRSQLIHRTMGISMDKNALAFGSSM